MTNSMNIPEIETLSHKPNKLTAETLEKSERGEDLHEFSNVKDMMKGINKPEQPKPRICEKCQVPNCSCRAVILKEPEQPNQQIMIIKAIQGLTTAILNDISKLPESVLKDQAYDDMNIFETGILFRLQKEYE